LTDYKIDYNGFHALNRPGFSGDSIS